MVANKQGASMFKKKTVFILGAGASRHYGYPTGEDLVTEIKQTAENIINDYDYPGLDGNSKWSDTAKCPLHYKGKIDKLSIDLHKIKDKLEQANPLVIDDFLTHNADIADIGRLLIAMVLLKYEKSGLTEGDWVRYVVQHLTFDCKKSEDLLANKVTFVTFNYDLSLEWRLHEALKNYKFFSDDGYSDAFFKPGRIFHVYGSLRDFDPANSNKPMNNLNGVIFPFRDEIDRAWEASLNTDEDGNPRIRTISSEKSAAREIVDAIAQAEYLYFLGYGFDRRNNQLLGLGNALVTKQAVYFTNFRNYNKVGKQVAKTFHLSERELIGDSYFAGAPPYGGGNWYPCEKSIKSVYDALAEDFDWPE
jgi:hypothetical protein